MAQAGVDYKGLSLLAKGNIPSASFVKVDSSHDNSCLAAGAGDATIGVSQEGYHDAPGLSGSTQYAAAADQNITIYSLGDVCRLTAGTGGWTRGQYLKPDANGAGVPATAVGDAVGAVAIESAAAGELARVQVLVGRVQATGGANDVLSLASANYTVTANDGGKTFFVGAANLVATLPATTAGLLVRFVVTAAALSAGTGFSISPAAADKIMGNGLTSADNKDLINSGATDAEGDTVTLIGDGDLGWYVINKLGTWAREA